MVTKAEGSISVVPGCIVPFSSMSSGEAAIDGSSSEDEYVFALLLFKAEAKSMRASKYTVSTVTVQNSRETPKAFKNEAVSFLNPESLVLFLYISLFLCPIINTSF